MDKIEAHLRHVRQTGRRIVMTNGCFDLLHPGHVASLQAARQYGDYLLVGLNSDRSAPRAEGAGPALSLTRGPGRNVGRPGVRGLRGDFRRRERGPPR